VIEYLVIVCDEVMYALSRLAYRVRAAAVIPRRRRRARVPEPAVDF
jgi:hypothetical protein